MILGIAIGVAFMILLILAFMVGYGMGMQRNNPDNIEQES